MPNDYLEHQNKFYPIHYFPKGTSWLGKIGNFEAEIFSTGNSLYPNTAKVFSGNSMRLNEVNQRQIIRTFVLRCDLQQPSKM
jgi:hypothetical protein